MTHKDFYSRNITYVYTEQGSDTRSPEHPYPNKEEETRYKEETLAFRLNFSFDMLLSYDAYISKVKDIYLLLLASL